ncbi:MAG TPA: RluA family pseudouridine synthase [Firmicutes bacterium]|nr:RluA family pseudouridine synthase [Bacillota bacterium]
MDERTFAVEKEDAGVRIDTYLAAAEEGLSRSQVQKLLEQGQVDVGGKKVKQNYKIKPGDLIHLTMPEPVEMTLLPEPIELDILYEDEDVIVINKPKGMVVHPAAGHGTGTLVNALLYHCAGQLSGINGVLRPGIVHRIDKDTSGVLVAAKSDAAHRGLAEQLARHAMKRRYVAAVMGNVKEETLTIDRPLGRSPKDRKKIAIVPGGKRAVTHITVLSHLGGYCIVEAQLETGRTHQIRVHMASIGHPLLGDTVYGPQKQPFALHGQALHAKVLGFTHPITGQYLEFEAPLPEELERLFFLLRQKA